MVADTSQDSRSSEIPHKTTPFYVSWVRKVSDQSRTLQQGGNLYQPCHQHPKSQTRHLLLLPNNPHPKPATHQRATRQAIPLRQPHQGSLEKNLVRPIPSRRRRRRRNHHARDPDPKTVCQRGYGRSSASTRPPRRKRILLWTLGVYRVGETV